MVSQLNSGIIFLILKAINAATSFLSRKSAQEFIVYESFVNVISKSVIPKYVAPTTLTVPGETVRATIIPDNSLRPSFNEKS